jgi:hypothetical protein
MGGSNLKLDLDRIPLWKGSHVEIKELVNYFFTYPYLPRITSISVLEQAIIDGISLPEWERDGFAYADSYDEDEKRFRGLKAGRVLTVDMEKGMVVKPDIAAQQLAVVHDGTGSNDMLYPDNNTIRTKGKEETADTGNTEPYGTAPSAPEKKLPGHFYAHKKIDPMHISRDIGKISEEIIQHLTSLINSQVTITLDIDATVPEGFTDEKRRVLSENCAVLKFEDSGFGE